MATKQEAAHAALGLAALQHKGFAPTFCQHERFKDGARIILEQQGAAPNLLIEVYPGPPSLVVVGTDMTRQIIQGVKEVSPTQHGVAIVAEYKGRRGTTEIIPNEGIIYIEETIPRPSFVPQVVNAGELPIQKAKGTDGFAQLAFAGAEAQEAEKVRLTGLVGNRPYYGPGKKQGGGPAFHFTFYVHPDPANPEESMDYNVHAYDALATRFQQKRLKVGQEVTIIGVLREREVETATGTHVTRHLNAMAILTEADAKKTSVPGKQTSAKRRLKAPPV